MSWPRKSEPLPAPFAWLLGGLVVAPLLARIPLLRVRGFNPDEFEHLHAGWLVAGGQLPYRDFFEHHTPGLYYLLMPLLRSLDAESVTDAWAAIFLARGWMVFFAAAALGLTFWFAHAWRGSTTAWFAVLFLNNAAIFLSKTLEIRPDVPALALYLAALLCCLWGLSATGSKAALGGLALGGVLLSVAMLFTQKLLFVLPGFGLALLWWLVRATDRPHRLEAALAGVAGFALPWGLTALFFWRRGALGSFVELNFLLNARWKHRLGPQPLFLELLGQEWLLLALAVIGAAFAWLQFRRPVQDRPETRVGSVLLGSTLASLLVGAFVIPVAQRQYGLLFLPPLALWAGAGVAGLVHEAAGLRRWSGWILVAVMALSATPSFSRLQASFARTNAGDLEAIRYVLRNVAANETVLDGHSGAGAFRPHAYYYFFLHDEIRAMLSAEDLLARLRRGEIAPKLVLFDRHLQEWSPELADFLRTHYADVGQPPIRVRLFDNGLRLWNEEGWRRLAGPAGPPLAEPHLLVGNGWRRVEVEGSRVVRRSRGQRSWLTLPVRDVGDFGLVLRARPDPADGPVDLDVAVNERPLGRMTLGRGWSETEWRLPAAVLRRGLNEVVFDAHAGGIALEAVRLQRRAR